MQRNWKTGSGKFFNTPKVLLVPAEGVVGDWGKKNVGLLPVGPGEVTRGRTLELE